MKRVNTKYYCDIRKCWKEEDKMADLNLQVIFLSEQTEGRGVDPYLYSVSIHLCQECLSKLYEGNYVFAHGAMGNNTYFFKDRI